MMLKERLKTEIDTLDERYLELLYNITRQFPHTPKQNGSQNQSNTIAALFQEIADTGGLGISNPEEWQREIRHDRPLPFREA